MESIITAIIVGGLSLVGVIYTNSQSNKKVENQLFTSQKVTEAKLEDLTQEVRRHNNFGDRITALEIKVQQLERIKYERTG